MFFKTDVYSIVLFFCYFVALYAQQTVNITVGLNLPGGLPFYSNGRYQKYIDAGDKVIKYYKDEGVIPRNLTIEHNFLSNSVSNFASHPGLAVENFNNLVSGAKGTNPKPASVMVGPYFSTSSLAVAPYASYRGITMISPSSDDGLSNKKIYSTFVRANTPAYDLGLQWAISIRKLGYRRFGIIHDSVSTQAIPAMEEGEKLFGYYIAGYYEVPDNLSRDDEVAMQKVRKTLETMKGDKIYAFMLGFSAGKIETHTSIFLEEAYKMGMFGNKNYNYYSAQTLTDAFFAQWDFGLAHPEAISGLIFKVELCTDSPIASLFAEALGLTRLTVSLTECLFWEAHSMAYHSVGKTTSYMNALGVDNRCLEHEFYFDSRNNCTTHNLEVKARLEREGNCAEIEKCTHCGVCEVLNTFEKDRSLDELNFWQIVLLAENYKWEVVSMYLGKIQLDKNGDRGLLGVEFAYGNVKLFKNPSTGALETKIENVATLDLKGTEGQVDLVLSPLNVSETIIYPGGSLEIPNTERVVDTIEDVIDELPVGFRISMFVLSGLLIVFTLIVSAIVLAKRKLLIIKTSTPCMMVLMSLGALLSFVSVIVLNLFSIPTDSTCIIFVWLLHLGWVFGFCSVLLTTYRLNLIFTSAGKGKGEVNLDDKRLSAIFASLLLAMIVYLSIWTAVKPPQVELQTILSKEIGVGNTITSQCSHSWFEYSIFIVELLFVSYGVVLAFSVRKLPSFYNNARVIGFVIYNWVFIMVVSQALVILIDLDSLVENLIISLGIFASMIVMLICFFVLKIVMIFQGKGNDIEKTKIVLPERMCSKSAATGKSTNMSHRVSTTDYSPNCKGQSSENLCSTGIQSETEMVVTKS